MGKPTIGELDTNAKEAQADKTGKLTVLEETSPKTIYNLLFSDVDNKDKSKGNM